MTIRKADMLRLWYTYTVVVSQVLSLETRESIYLGRVEGSANLIESM